MVEKRTETAPDVSPAGPSENTKPAQQEHHRSITADALPPDLAAVVDAWPTLPPNIKAAIKALLDTTGGK